MKLTKLLLFGVLMAGWIALASPADAQLQPQDPDPLARMRAAAASQAKACTVKEPSACAEATPKIVANALASPHLADNLTRLSEIGDKAVGKGQIAAWTETAFRDAGVDEVHTEPLNGTQTTSGVNVVAEIRGREKPGDFILLGARLPSGSAANSVTDEACNAALVIEAARDIHLTGLRPLRSIRFVLFGGELGEFAGSRAYVESHRADLDHAIAAVIFEKGCGQVNGFSLGGRHDVEPGVREAFAVPPIDAWHVGNDTYDAPWSADNLDFLLEGVPTLMPNRDDSANTGPGAGLDTVKHNSAIAGVLAFALAEHPEPLGPRLSRAEVATLLKKSDLEAPMKAANIWQDWEDGKRGGRP
jgi:hypothetical protein